MRILERRFILENSKYVILRSPETSDAKEMIDYLYKSAGETNYLSRYPEEINISLEAEKKYISKQLESEKSFDIAAFVDGKLVGNSTVFALGDKIKTMHRAEYGISILKEYWNKKIGTMLTEYCLESAKEIGYEQIELSVVEDNINAINLYKKNGFTLCGTIENAEKLKDGSYQNLYMMICKF
ncbi:GNAT family N-acetyltransferase [Clostridium frigidicarnis]|nr:GNAT family N-acetyltransferase [Clostridium frigidicarnis]